MEIGKSEKRAREEFGQRLKQAIDKKRMKQKVFADKVGVSDSTVSRYISGVMLPGAYTLDKICEVLG